MKKQIYLILFSILYLITAFSSFFHAVEFFELSNVKWMSIILALAFEVGQAAVLMSILTSSKERSKITPWILMGILTLVQIIGNVYSSYKYIIINSPDNLRFFKEPIFIWTNLPDEQANVIITYVSAAILPVCALLLTSMVTNYLESDEQKEQEEKKVEEKFEEENQKEVEQTFPQLIVKNTPIVHESPIESGIEVPKLAEPLEFAINNEELKPNELEEDYKEEEESTKIEEEQPIPEEIDNHKDEESIPKEIDNHKDEESIPEEIDNLFDGPIKQNLSEFSQQSTKKKSHFVNI